MKTNLGSPAHRGLLAAALKAKLLGLLCSLSCGFPQTFRVPGFSNFLTSSLHFWFHSHSLAHYFLRGTLLGLLGCVLKAGRKPPWTHNYCILHACKSSTTRVMLSFGTVARPHCYFYCGCRDLSVPRWLSTMNWILGNQFPGWSFWGRAVWASLLKTSLLDLLACEGWDVTDFSDIIKSSFLLSWHKLPGFFLMLIFWASRPSLTKPLEAPPTWEHLSVDNQDF